MGYCNVFFNFLSGEMISIFLSATAAGNAGLTFASEITALNIVVF